MRRPSGFSLLELMVALLFMGLLLAGMVQVYLASLGSWTRVNEGLALRRALRLAMDRIAEDLRMLGHRFPPPELRALEPAAGADPRPPYGFTLVPGAPADELSFITDAPLPVPAELGRAIQGAPLEVPVLQLRTARAFSLEAGDLLLVAGEHCECARVEGTAELDPGRPGPVRVARADRAAGAVFLHPHGAGAPVQAVRPLRLVRYAVVGLNLQPGRRRRDRAGPVPCLVRFETACPRAGAAPRWTRLLEAAHGREGSHEVVAEHVAGFRVEYAADGPFPNEGRAAMVDHPGAAGGLLRVRLELAHPVARGGPPDRPATCGQTLVIAPRNFGL